MLRFVGGFVTERRLDRSECSHDRDSAGLMPIWTKLLIVVAVATIITAWGWVLDLSLSAVHAWLVEFIGHTGMRLLIGAMVFAGAWALWKETEDR
ncbi:hypothetical protein [Methylobacterium sp. B4]|nr:hypothetical protein [Methylobacterium sp. B4]